MCQQTDVQYLSSLLVVLAGSAAGQVTREMAETEVAR